MKHETKLKEQFKDRLIDWTQDRLDVPFGNLNNVQQSRQMIQFFLMEILERLAPGLVPDDEGELENCIVDGAGDGGADFLYRSDDGQVVIIQAKYRGKDATEQAESIGRFCDFPERLYLAMQGKDQALSAYLLDLAGQIDWEQDRFRLYFITTGKTGEAARARAEQGVNSIKALPDFVEERVDFSYLDQSLLNQELREALSSADFSNTPIKIQMLPDTSGNPWCHFEQDSRELYIGEVNGAILASILEQHKASLFTMNIRDYVGDTRTNKQIIGTATTQPENFEYFNNGVTAVAGRVTADVATRTLTCERMSIINGAQTVRSLKIAARKKNLLLHKPVSKVRVLLRLISFAYPSEVGFVGELTKYNNTQNAVKIADFRSNDRVQLDMAKRFSELNLNGRSYEYKNKRSDKKKNTIPITLEELTKAVFAFRFGPDDYHGGTSKLFDSSAGGLYTRLYEAPDSSLSNVAFNTLAGTFFACDYVKQLWEALRKARRSQGASLHPALERKGLVYFAFGELERMSYKLQALDLDQDLAKLAKPNAWLSGAESKPKVALSKAFDISTRVLIQQYDQRKQANPNFKHRNWFRDTDTLTAVRMGLELALQFGYPPKLSI